MKNLNFLLTFFLCMFLLVGTTYAMPVYFDLDGAGITGDTSFDSDNQTDLFTKNLFTAETTVTQYDTDDNGQVNSGDYFTDEGSIAFTGFRPTGMDDEGLGIGITSDWYMTGVLTGLAGTVVKAETDANNDTRIDYEYSSGTMDLYANQDLEFDFGSSSDRTSADDVGFDNGTKIASFNVSTGYGRTFLDIEGGVLQDRTQGSGKFIFESSWLLSDFWFNEDGEDLATIYGEENPINWFINIMDYDVNDPELEFAPPGSNYLFTSDVTHEGGLVYDAVPEPSTMILLGLGLLGLSVIGRKKYLK